MDLSQQAIDEYKQIYKKEFGKEISDDEARKQGNNLIGFFEVLLKIDRRIRSEKKIRNLS